MRAVSPSYNNNEQMRDENKNHKNDIIKEYCNVINASSLSS